MNSLENLRDLIIYQSRENDITYHLQNIFKTGELEQDSVT